jgi:hypothetical protein
MLKTLRLQHAGASPTPQAQVTLAGAPHGARASRSGQDIAVELDTPVTLGQRQVLSVTLT